MIVLHDDGRTRRLFAYGTWFILVHGFACWLARRRIPLIEMRFRASAPSDDSDYRMRFCEDVTFSAEETLIRFDRSFLDLKLSGTEASLRAFLENAPANILVKYRNESSTTAQVRRRLRNQAPDDWPDLDALSRLLNLSAATLQRRLLAEGTNYRQLKDELRRDIAIELFSNTSLTVAEVAARTGFQEASAFTGPSGSGPAPARECTATARRTPDRTSGGRKARASFPNEHRAKAWLPRQRRPNRAPDESRAGGQRRCRIPLMFPRTLVVMGSQRT